MFLKWILAVLLLNQVSAQVNDQQLKDAAKMRDELSAKLSPELKATPAKQAEVDAIRNEILNAVKGQTYKMSPSALPTAAPETKDPIVGSPLWNRIHFSQKSLYELVATPKPETEIPKNMKFLGKFNLNSNSYRDIIDLVEVHENLNFDATETVLIWRTIPNSLTGNRHLLLGLTNTSLILACLAGGTYQLVNELKIADEGLNPNTFEVFLHWNNNDGHSEGYAILVVNTELHWIRLGVDGNFDKLELMWRWPIYKKITEFKYYRFKNESMIFFADEKSPTLDIYRFNLDNKEASQIQMIRSLAPCKNIALVEWKRQLLLALPLDNITKIYKYSDREHQFAVIATIPTKGVTKVAGFQAGGLCFFAIAGEDPKILRYRHNDFSNVKVINKPYQFVRSFFPITIHTFRDDVLLLAESEVIFEPHTLCRIETLRWNGEAFETFFNVPCYMDDTLHYNGINCLIDSDESMGLKGAVVLTKSSNVSILVPRKNARSGLFDLKIEIRAAPHPKEEKLIDIQMMFDYFSTLKQHNNLVFANALEAIKNAVLPNKEMVVTGAWTVGVLDATVVIPDVGIVENIEKSKTETGATVSSKELVPPLQKMVKDLLIIEQAVNNSVPREEEQKARNNEEISQPRLQLEKIRVTNLEFESINGIAKDDIVWRLEDSLKFMNPFEVNSLTVLKGFEGRINGIDLKKDLIHSENNLIAGRVLFDHLDVTKVSSANGINDRLLESISRMGNHFADISVDELLVDEDLQVHWINGFNWRNTSRNMIDTDFISSNISLLVDGSLILESDMELDHLNDDPFVENYLWDGEDLDHINVVGKKQFKRAVVVDEIDMIGGDICGISPNRLISLGGGAYLPNETVFDTLELVQGLAIDDPSAIEGPHMDKFLANPTLKEERLVGAACAFRSLRVEGNIILKGLFNNMNLNLSLSDFVYTTEQPMKVNGFNKFKQLQANNIQTDFLNGKQLHTFVTLNTEQNLTLSQLVGRNFRFDYMRLGGLFDSINISELYDKVVLTSGDQVTDAHLVFQISDDDESSVFVRTASEVEVTARNIYVRETLNGHRPDVFIHHSNIAHYKGLISAHEIFIDRLYLDGNLVGQPIINGHHMDEYDSQRWSKTKIQTITSPVVVQNLINADDFMFVRMNSMGTLELASALDVLSGFKDNFHNRDIDELHIIAGGEFDHINEEFMHKLMSNVIWLNESNVLNTDIICLDQIRSEYTIQIKGSLNGEQSFLRRVVWKDYGLRYIKLKGTIQFHKDVVVEGHLNTTSINTIEVAQILRKDQPIIRGNVLMNTLKIHSQLIAPHWDIVPDFPAHRLRDVYKYDAVKDVHEITLDRIFFTFPTVIPYLNVGGALNGVPNIVDFLNSIQHADSPRIILKVTKTNVDSFDFKDLRIEYVDGYNLEQFMAHAVVRTGTPIRNISGKVQFSNVVDTSDVRVSDISVENLNGMKAEKWFGDTIKLSQSYEWTAPFTLSSTKHKFISIHPKEVNGIPFEKFQFKHVDYNLKVDAFIENMIVDGFVDVSGFVNGRKLFLEEKNSFKTFSPVQKLVCHSIFERVRVINELIVEGFVNGENFSHIIYLDGQNININSPITFLHLQTKDVSTTHTIDGLTFDEWHKDSLKYSDDYPQVVNGYWHVNRLTVKDSISGEDHINGRNIKSLIAAYESHRPQIEQYESEMQFSYWKMCTQVKEYFSSPLRVGCSFKHLTEAMQLDVAGIQSMLVFRHLDQYYMIFSTGCSSHLLLWNSTSFQEIEAISSGNVMEWMYVPSSSPLMHLVSRNAKPCPNVYANSLWVWNSQKRLVVVKQLSPNRLDDVMVHPMKRNYFYTIGDDKVREHKVPSNEITMEWVIQSSTGQVQQFLPSAYGSLEILVAGGDQIHTIQIKPSNRYKRHWLRFGARSKRVEEKYKLISQIALTNKTDFMKSAISSVLKKKLTTDFEIPYDLNDEMRQESRMMERSGTKNVSTVNDPTLGGALFDDVQNRIKEGAKSLADINDNLLNRLDEKYDVEEILDLLEEEMLSRQYQSESPEPVVGGQLFDNIQNMIQEGAETFTDASADTLEGLDKFIDLDKVFNELSSDGRSGDNIPSQIGNSSHFRHSSSNNNSYDGEVVALRVGAGREIRTLYGVYNPEKTSSGNDVILIYENLLVDIPFQVINCNRPSSLTAWNMDQETLLIFLEEKRIIQIYVFRGMVGFVHYLQVKNHYAIDYLRTAFLPWAPCGCVSHFLMAATKNNVFFLKADTVGHCVNELIECNDY